MKAANWFTLKQVFNIVDGRLMTNIQDIDDLLGASMGEVITCDSHRLFAMEFVTKKKPEWYQEAYKLLLSIYDKVGFNVDQIEKYIDENYFNAKFLVTKEE